MNRKNNTSRAIGTTGAIGTIGPIGVTGFSGKILYTPNTEGIVDGDIIFCETVDSTISKLLGNPITEIHLKVVSVHSGFIGVEKIEGVLYDEICKFYCNEKVYYIETNRLSGTTGTSGATGMSGPTGVSGVSGIKARIELVNEISKIVDNNKNSIFDKNWLIEKFNITENDKLHNTI